MKGIPRHWLRRAFGPLGQVLFVSALLLGSMLSTPKARADFWDVRVPILICLGICIGGGVIVCLCMDAVRPIMRRCRPEPRGFEVIPSRDSR